MLMWAMVDTNCLDCCKPASCPLHRSDCPKFKLVAEASSCNKFFNTHKAYRLQLLPTWDMHADRKAEDLLDLVSFC